VKLILIEFDLLQNNIVPIRYLLEYWKRV